MNKLPIKVEELAAETQKDAELSELYRKIKKGEPLKGKEGQLSIEAGCIFFGCRAYIALGLQERVLQELHLGRPGVQRMKGLARGYQGIHKIKENIAAVLNTSVPTSSTEVRSFLGMVIFHAKYIPKLADLAVPLY